MRTLRNQTITVKPIQTNFLAPVVRLLCGDYTTDPKRVLKAEIQTINPRLKAAKRALGMANKLSKGEFRTKHKSRIMGNINRLRAQLKRLEKQQHPKVIKCNKCSNPVSLYSDGTPSSYYCSNHETTLDI